MTWVEVVCGIVVAGWALKILLFVLFRSGSLFTVLLRSIEDKRKLNRMMDEK